MEKSNVIATAGQQNKSLAVTPEQLALVKSQIAPDATEGELKLFLYDCERRGVHPLDKMIFFIKRKSADGSKKATHQCSIDFYRSVAESSGQYDGQDEPEFGPIITGQGIDYPEWAKVKIYRKGITRPFVGIAYWKEYYPGPKLGFMWGKMPKGQLAKCAETLAFRRAFPKLLKNLHTDVEMEQADVVEGEVVASKSASVVELPPDEGGGEAQEDAAEGTPLDWAGMLATASDKGMLMDLWSQVEEAKKEKDITNPEFIELRKIMVQREKDLG